MLKKCCEDVLTYLNPSTTLFPLIASFFLGLSNLRPKDVYGIIVCEKKVSEKKNFKYLRLHPCIFKDVWVQKLSVFNFCQRLTAVWSYDVRFMNAVFFIAI